MSTEAQTGGGSDSRALLVCPDAGMAAEFSALLAAELPALQIETLGNYPSPAETAEAAGQVQACFLDITSNAGSAAAIMTRIASDLPTLPVVALLQSNDPDLILKYLRLGAAEFQIQPFPRDQLERILRKLAPLRAAAHASIEGRGKVFCIVPGKGASGATTIACNLAYAIKGLKGAKVLLADLDGLTGTVAFVLKLKSPYSFVDAISHTGALDAGVWKALVTPWQGLDVLLSPENPIDCYAEAIDPTRLLKAARQTYDVIVVDTGGIYGEWNSALARQADEIVIATTNELPVLHATQRALGFLDRVGVGRSRPRVVVNRHQSRRGLADDAVAAALGATVFRTLPNDTDAIGKALMEGKPVPHNASFGRGVAALARALAGGEPRAAKPSLVSSLLKLFG